MGLADQLAERVAEHTALLGETIRDEFRAGLKETRNGLRIKAARSAPVRAGLNAVSPGRLVGWSLKENAGTPAPAVVTIYNGRDTSADVLAVIPLTAGGGDTKLPAAPGVDFGDGLYVDVAGAVTGALYFGAVD